MISAITSTALSGLQAASLRLAASASNTANAHSTGTVVDGQRVQAPYAPVEVTQSSVEPAGVRADIRPRDPASVSVYAPGHPDADADGIVAFPNVSLEEEVITQQFAAYDYKANLKVLKTAGEMLQNVLDIKS